MEYYKTHKITLPKELLDSLKKDDDYSEKIREDLSIRFNFKKLKNDSRMEELRAGYENMASINLSFAEMGLLSDVDSLEDYEGTLLGVTADMEMLEDETL